jgi:cellulose synthase (UDP-forming)
MIALAVLLVLTLPLVYSAIVVPLVPYQQALAAMAMIGLAILACLSPYLRPAIIFLSCFASLRYFYWRIRFTINLDSASDSVVSLLLLAAEIYGLLILFLGYFQTIEVVERTPARLKQFPSVDVFIPTYNEPVDIVRRTLIGALAIDYPHMQVHVLDDGRRPEIQAMTEALGAAYITRRDNRHAKAGNLNHALQLTKGELIAVFDADHIPVRSFLRHTAGFFVDARVALVQTAQHFFNPDPYERNLKLTGRIPPEQHFFYHVIQCGNDFWNSAFFCGSCAVLRRSAIESIGGIKTETVTEDAHTAVELHARGFESVYLGIPLAAGLATETFAAHVKQRMRWARGMAQILRCDCPLLKRGLTFPQRLNYFNAMLHFFFGIPRLILIVAPLTFAYLGLHPIRADALAVIAYILPHVGLSTIANSIISRRFRHSFWAAVYEVSIAPYTAGVTLLALLNPRLGKFNVTDKGTNLNESYFDLRTNWVTVVLLGLSMAALMVAFPVRLLWFVYYGGPHSELDSILLNSVWVVLNLIILVAATCVGLEQPQQRLAPRVKRRFPCELGDADGPLFCRTVDLSESGARLHVDCRRPAPLQAWLRISSDFGVQARVFARLVWSERNASGETEAAYAFQEVDDVTRRDLIQLMFSGERSWVEQQYPRDSVLRSFWYLLTTFWRVTRPRKSKPYQMTPSQGSHMRRGASAAALLALNFFACSAIPGTHAQPARPPDVLRDSWRAYSERFIQQDGRVIDYRADGMSTSEGQAYAMLRAVWVNDRPAFDKTYTWAVNNLNAGSRTDHLWAWKWGQDVNGQWHALDRAFATDADQDAALALVLASVVWKEPRYLAQARGALTDIWNLATIPLSGKRYLLAGDSLCQGPVCRINPSYYAPYAYRVFQKFDSSHNWGELVDSSYVILNSVSRLTSTHLPPDWAQLNTRTGTITLLSPTDSVFSYDAFRTYWRVALDYYLNRDPRAVDYLKFALAWFDTEWNRRGSMAAVISAKGEPKVEYQSYEMLAGVMPAMRLVDAPAAARIERKLASIYALGIWGERDSYYLQNWAWFGAALYQGYLGPLRIR